MSDPSDEVQKRFAGYGNGSTYLAGLGTDNVVAATDKTGAVHTNLARFGFRPPKQSK